MTFYKREIERIRATCYFNDNQIKTVIRTRNLIHNHFDKKLNLDVLSKNCFISKFHLLRLFKRYYGQTPKQYLTDRRIEKAKEFLKSGRNITDTCFNVGFECPSSFCTLFKSRIGITPTDFQKRATFTKSC